MKKYLQLLTKGTDINVIDIRECKYCGEEFPFYDLERDILQKYGFKNTEQCALCNFKMQNYYFNDKNLYRRKDSFGGDIIISTLSESYTGKVMEAKSYRKKLSDDYGLQFGKDISSDIFSDFTKLYNEFPAPSRLVYPGTENSEYASHIGRGKNIYLSYCTFIDVEDIYHSLRVIARCKDVYSSYNVLDNCANIYASSVIGKSSDIFFSHNIINSNNIRISRDINNSQECIFCCNQVNAKYKVFNMQYTKKEYEKIKSDIMKRIKNPKQFDFLMKKYQDFLENNYVEQSINMNRCEKVVGETTFDSKNTINSYVCSAMENCINTFNGGDDLTDTNLNILHSSEFGTNCQNIVGSCSFGMNVYNCFFSFKVAENCKNIYYSADIETCEECMFSVGLRNKKYCILNKQYDKDAYFKLKESIIQDLQERGLWGESIGWELGFFPYNDTTAYDYFKVYKVIYHDGREEVVNKNANGIVRVKTDAFISEAVLDLGGKEKINIKWRTKNMEINISKNIDTLTVEDLQDIDSVDESILKKAIICEESGRPFRIVKRELEFLKKKGLPLPRIHHTLRIEKLLGLRPTGKLYIGKSDLSGEDILTVYKEKPKWKIYSHEEYQDFMYK